MVESEIMEALTKLVNMAAQSGGRHKVSRIDFQEGTAYLSDENDKVIAIMSVTSYRRPDKGRPLPVSNAPHD